MKAYINETKIASLTNLNYQLGQELIWDSGAGFDVVTFKDHTDLLNGKMLSCCLKTGIMKGKVIPIEKHQLEEFSLNKWAEMRRKYQAS